MLVPPVPIPTPARAASAKQGKAQGSRKSNIFKQIKNGCFKHGVERLIASQCNWQGAGKRLKLGYQDIVIKTRGKALCIKLQVVIEKFGVFQSIASVGSGGGACRINF